MNTLLVYPQYPDTFWSFKHVLKFVFRKAAFPPLGLLTVASMLPKTWNKKLIDLNVTELKDEDLKWADMVFLSAMIVQKDSAREIIKRCKRQKKIVVAGGPLFTTQHEKFNGVDHFVLNEAEITLPLFLKDLDKGEVKRLYISKVRPDITKTPIPDWSLINIKDYVAMLVQHSRGCPFNCEFCDIVIMNGRVPRVKRPKQLIDELQVLYNLGWRGTVFIVDDNFIGNKARVKKMLPFLIDWQGKKGYPFKFVTEASVNLADDDSLMEMMSKANFDAVFLGIETPSNESLKECNKTQNMGKDLLKAVKTIQQKGMQVLGGFIVGFDSDPENIFDMQIKFIQQSGITVAMVGLLGALPKTRLWHRLKLEKRLFAETTGENTDGSLNFIPKMGKERLVEGYRRILATIYSPRYYYQRIDTFIKNYNPAVRAQISRSDIYAFFRSVWEIGILSKERFFYWRLIFKTCLTKTKAFPTAVELAVYSLHFDKVTKRILNAQPPIKLQS